MYLKKEEGFGLFIIIIGIVFVLVLAGSNLTFFGGRASDRKMDELSRSAARMGLSMAIEGVQNNIGSETAVDPAWAAFFQDTDINGDGIIARDGEVDSNRDGIFNLSTVEKNITFLGRNGIDDDGDGIIDDLPGVSGNPEIAPTEDDRNGNRIQDLPDGRLEDAFGIILTDASNQPIIKEDIGSDGRPDFPYNVPSGHPLFGLFEAGYDPVNNPDPAGDDYHPIFNPTGTEGNGKFDPGEIDFNSNGKLDTVESGLQKWLSYSKRIQMGTFTAVPGVKSKAFYGNINVRVLDTNSKINLNGADAVLTARLLNNLLRVSELVPKTFNMALTMIDESVPEQDNSLSSYVDERGDGKDSDGDSITDDGTFLGLNSRGIEYDCELDGTIVNNPAANQKNNVGTTTARADDADAVLVVKFRNSLPDKRFISPDQLLDVSRPGASIPSACTSPMLTRKAGRIFDRGNVNRDPAQTEDQAIFINNIDEFERLKNFITTEGWEDVTAAKADPSDTTRLAQSPVYPVGLNTSPKEVLHAVLATGIMNADISAVEPLADAITTARIQKPFRSWNEFEKFMDDTIGTDTAKMNAILLRDKARLIAQLKPDTSLQGFNPNSILVRPLDKTRVGTPTTELSLVHSGYYEIDSLGIITGVASQSIDEDLLLQLGVQGTTTVGGELGRKEVTALVKIMDLFRHTTQKEFEDVGTTSVFKSFQTKSTFRVSSYPENMKDVEITMGSSSGKSLNFDPTVIEIDEVTGNVYVGGDTDLAGNNNIGIWRYNKTDAPALSQIGTATITGLAPGTYITFLSIDPFFTSTDFGRMYAGISNSNTIKVFDITGTTTPDRVIPKQRKDVEGVLGVIPKKTALDAGHKVIAAITNTSGSAILEWRYPPADVHALPEIDNLNTPLINEAVDGLDNDSDFSPDDTGTSTRGMPETLIDGADNDADGEIDDSVRPKPTQPKRPDSLLKTPFVVSAGFSDPAADIVLDDNLEQYFVIGTNTVVRLRDSVGTHTLENVGFTTLSPPFITKAMTIDKNDNYIYVLGSSTSDELVKFSTTGIPTTLPELDRLPLGSVTANTKRIVMDGEDDLIFILGKSVGETTGTVTAISARGERLRIMPVLQIGTTTADATAIGIDSKRNRVYIAEKGGASARIKVFEYKINNMLKQIWTDGQIQLTHNSVPLGSDTAILYRSDFYSDFNLMGTNTANQFGTETPILVGTGTPLLIMNGGTQTPFLSNSLFTPPGTVTVRLSPDGIIAQTSSTVGTVSGSVISYAPSALFGAGTITVDNDGRGIRYGAMEFWIKFPRITNPWAVPEVNVINTTDDDLDGVINDTIANPAGSPETDTNDGIDNDADGYVDDVVGIGIDAATRPNEIVLSRLAYNVQMDNEIFVTKNNGASSRGEQLSRIIGTSTSILDGFIWASGSTTTYTIFSKLSLKEFKNNSDALVDNAMLELERLSFPGTITVTGTYTTMQSITNEPIHPGTATYCVGTTSLTLKPGKWQNIAYNWWIETTGSSTEIVKQEMFIDGSGTVTTGQYIGTDTSFLLGTVTERLKDLPGSLAFATSTLFHIGTKIFGTGTTSSLTATIDDLVIYNGTSSVTGNPQRFASAFGTDTAGRGEPFQDCNLNFRRDAFGHKFKDENHNGLFDVGEAFDMGSATAVGHPYDSSGEFYSFYGEQFTDAGTSTLANEYDSGELYIDYNRNGKWDRGELYTNVPTPTGTTTAYEPPGVPLTDDNHDHRPDDSGYLIRNFDTVLSQGDRVGAVSWTEYLPDKTDVSLELTLKALDGKILWRWFGGDGTSTGTRIDLPAPEDAILEYRANLFAVGTQTESPVIDDITVTVIKKTPEIISFIEK